LVSRDRGGDYAAAGRCAVPAATQTADRFHLTSKPWRGFGGRPLTSSCCSPACSSRNRLSYALGGSAPETVAEIESKGNAGEPGEAGGAPSPISANRRFT
jgi:hypothetical protein